MLRLDFYGITVGVDAPPDLLEEIRKDFSFFAAKTPLPGEAAVEIRVAADAPPYDKVPPVRASLVNADSVAYDDGETRYVDYHGKALTVYDYGRERGELYSGDGDLRRELAYLLIHSRVGELLDRLGLHRVHALGVSAGGRGILCLLPQGGGKTTLALRLLEEEGIRLLSDDTPLITRTGQLLPFPVRIGIDRAAVPAAPAGYVSEFRRRKHGTKTLIDIDYYRDRLSPPVPARTILVGKREFSDRPRLVQAGKFAALGPLFRDCVAGLGLPQMVEYFLRPDPRDLVKKTGIVLSRAAAAAAVLRRADVYVFVIGRDTGRNARVLADFLKQKGD